MNSMLFFIQKVLSYSPLLRVTDDSRFNEITKNPKKLRISLFSFNIGIKSFYFITRDHSKKLKWFHTLNLFEVQKYRKNIEDYGDEYDIYKVELVNKTDENISAEKEFLNFRISEISNIKNKTFNKFLAYLAIFAFLFPLYTTKITNFLPYLKSYKILFIIILLYILLNLISLAISFVKVRQLTRTVFSNIKSSNTPLKELNALLFYEWKILNNESNFEVAVIKNLEKYMFGIVLVSVLFMLSINIEEWSKTNNHFIDNTNVQNNSELIVFEGELEFNEFLKVNNTKINRIKEEILQDKYNTIILISSGSNNVSQELIELFTLYKENNTSIISIKESSYTNRIEVILLKEE